MLRKLLLLCAIGIFAGGCALSQINQVTSGKITFNAPVSYYGGGHGFEKMTFSCKKIEVGQAWVKCTNLDDYIIHIDPRSIIKIEPFEIGG